jgi:hypothetical protein
MNDREIQITRSNRQNLAFFFRAEMPEETVRLWSGAGDWALADIDVSGDGAGIYIGAGGWGGGLPDIDMLMDGQAQGLTLSLAATDLTMVKAFLADRRLIVGAPAAFGWGILDSRYKLAGPVRWPLRGQLSQPRIARTRKDDQTTQRLLSVTVISGAYARRRGDHAYYAAVDQKRRSPTDDGCNRTGLYRAETTRPLPR